MTVNSSMFDEEVLHIHDGILLSYKAKGNYNMHGVDEYVIKQAN